MDAENANNHSNNHSIVKHKIGNMRERKMQDETRNTEIKEKSGGNITRERAEKGKHQSDKIDESCNTNSVGRKANITPTTTNISNDSESNK